MKRIPFIIPWLAGLVLATTTVAASGATGSIHGSVTTIGPDGVSIYLPGAEIALGCEKAAASGKTTLTDETGLFVLRDLAPDKCTLTASEQGFESATKPVEITESSSLEVSFQLKITAMKEQMTVSGDAPVVETTETSAKGTVSRESLEHAPLQNERFTEAIPLLPGVVRSNDGSLNIKGTRSNQSALLINGANVTDPVTGEFAFNAPIDAVQSFQVLSNPYDTQYGNFTGAVTAVQTRAGRDKFNVEFHDFLPRFRRRAGHFVGLASVTPRLDFSGPIQKGKSHFTQTLEYDFVRTRVPGLRHLDKVLQSDTQRETVDSHTQLDFDLNPSNSLQVNVSVFPQRLKYVNLDTFNPQGVTPSYHQRGVQLGITERTIFSGQSFLESLFFFKKFDADVFPSYSASPVMILRPEENEGSFFNQQHRNSQRYEWQEVYHLRPVEAWGQHLIRGGINVTHAQYDGVDVSRPVQIQRSDTTLAQLIEFVGPTSVNQSVTQSGGFLQDTWTLHSRVTFDLGVRYDRDTLGNNNNVAPRFGFAIALTSDKRTVLRGGIGRFVDKIPLNAGSFEQFQSQRVTRFAADGVTPLGPPLQFQNAVFGRLVNPRSVAWNAELDRELTRNLQVRVGYQQRQGARDFIVNPILTPQPTLLMTSTGKQFYREYEVSGTYRFNERSHLFASYVHSRATGDLNDFNQFFGNFENPIIRPNERSFLPFDAPNRFLTWAAVGLPLDIMTEPVFEVRQGFPYSLVNANLDFVGPRNRAGRYPTFVNLDVQVDKGFRLPWKLNKHKARIGIKFFNVTNHFNPRDFQNNIDSLPVTFRQDCSQFGQFCNTIPRHIGGRFVLEY